MNGSCGTSKATGGGGGGGREGGEGTGVCVIVRFVLSTVL